jgi:hypothetical protein
MCFKFFKYFKSSVRKSGKKNCIEVISPPSGENWFFDPILTFMCGVGQIKNAKKSNFPLDHCFNKRVLYFNEPNFENSFRDTFIDVICWRYD